MSLLENNTIAVDESAWPSSYYGKCQRVDLEKFFQKVQQEQLEQQQLDDEKDRQMKQQQQKSRRRVSFDPDPPTVCVYEPEYETPINCFELHSSKDTWPSYARRPPHRLDLRPIRNEQYGQPITTTTIPPLSQSSPTTPPLSPSSPSYLDLDSSDDDDDDNQGHPTTVSPWIPNTATATSTSTSTTTTPTSTSTPPFSPATLTKKLMTAVFTRRKRSQ